MNDGDNRLLMLIDDEPAQSRLISALAAREGWRTIVVSDSETAIATLGTRQGMQLSAIILDQWVPGDDACRLIEELKARRPALPLSEPAILTSRTDGRARGPLRDKELSDWSKAFAALLFFALFRSSIAVFCGVLRPSSASPHCTRS